MKRIAALAVAVAVLVSVGASAAMAQEEPEPIRTTSTTLPGATALGSGYSFTKAVINTPDQPTREFDARHAAIFVQSFLPWLVYGKPEVQTPPDGVPISRVDVTGNFAAEGSGIVPVYYATDGATVWLSYPKFAQPYKGDPAAYVPTPADNWVTVPSRVTEAFNGTAELLDTLGTELATAPPTTAAAAKSTTSDSGSFLPWIIAAIVVIVAIGLLVMRRRRRVDDGDDEGGVRETGHSGKA